MEQQDQSLDAHINSEKEIQNTKTKRRDQPPVFKKSTSFAKLAAKITRKRSLRDKSVDKQESADEQVFTSTEDTSLNSSLTDSGPRSPPMPTPVLVPLTKTSSKSEDSLDSGIYSRQKSCDSVESLESTGSSGNGTECQTRPVMSYTTVTEGISPTDERAHSSMNANKFDDYWREYQDIRQSIIVQPDDDIDEKRSVTRTDSGDDEDEGEWLRQAGLADLVTAASLSQGAESQTVQSTDRNSGTRLSTDSLTSMTILSTLTRPQREAVLRRITSFNRAQKSRRRPKPHINAVFTQELQGDEKDSTEGMDGKPPLALPTVEAAVEGKKSSVNKSTSLPPNITGFGEVYPRRYSEIHQRPVAHMGEQNDGSFLNSSLLSSYSTSSLHTSHVVKLDQKGYQKKEALESILATEPPANLSCSHASVPSTSLASVQQLHSPVTSLYSKKQALTCSLSTPLTLSITKALATSMEPRSHFTFPPRRVSPKHDHRYVHPPIYSVPHIRSPQIIGSKYSSLHLMQNPLPSERPLPDQISEEFNCTDVTDDDDLEPFEFSPITLTTAMTQIRYTRVIRSTPVSPLVVLELPSPTITSVRNSLVLPISSTSISTQLITHNSESSPTIEDTANNNSDAFRKDKNSVRSSSDSDLNPALSNDQSNLDKQNSDYIAFTSALGISNEDSYPPNNAKTNLPLYSVKHRRHGSLKSRRSKSTNQSPRHSSIKTLQNSLQKVTALSFSNLTTSPTRSGTHKLRKPSPSSRRLKRASSLYDDLSHPFRAVSKSTNLGSHEIITSSIETLSIQSRSTDDPNWQSSGGNFAEDSKSVPMSYSETADQENLPNFSLVKDRLGITRISDLSPPDIRKVQSLALIELTALFDLHNIDLKRRKLGKAKIKETGLFGIALTTLLEWDQKRQGETTIRVPLVLQEIITFVEKNGLNDEGILRVPGSALRIKNLKQELENRFSQSSPIILLDPNAGWSEARTNDVAALLKQFLRELPNPLLSSEYIDAFQSCDLIPDRKQQLQALNLLIILLNEVHRNSLKLLLKFLSRIVAKEEVNKMSLNNVAMIMAPNLFMAKKSTKRGDLPSVISANQDVKHAAGTSNIVRMLVKYHKLLWTVPTFMLTQVRNMNQAEHSSKKHHGQSKDKLRIKFLSGKSKEPHSKSAKSPNPSSNEQFEYEVPKGVIRVKVENHSMTSMAVQLDAKTTAGDVIAKFEKQCERAKQMSPDSDITMITSETHALYEVGGNIYERCLDPGTNMHALTKINGDAVWVIKKRTTS